MINQGVAFGLFAEIPVWVIVLVWIGLAVYAVKMRELWGRIGIVAMLIGGALNIWSRARYGGVRDDLNLLGLVYNNGADYLIFFGLLLYGYTYFVRRQRDSGPG